MTFAAYVSTSILCSYGAVQLVIPASRTCTLTAITLVTVAKSNDWSHKLLKSRLSTSKDMYPVFKLKKITSDAAIPTRLRDRTTSLNFFSLFLSHGSGSPLFSCRTTNPNLTPVLQYGVQSNLLFPHISATSLTT